MNKLSCKRCGDALIGEISEADLCYTCLCAWFQIRGELAQEADRIEAERYDRFLRLRERIAKFDENNL